MIANPLHLAMESCQIYHLIVFTIRCGTSSRDVQKVAIHILRVQLELGKIPLQIRLVISLLIVSLHKGPTAQCIIWVSQTYIYMYIIHTSQVHIYLVSMICSLFHTSDERSNSQKHNATMMPPMTSPLVDLNIT